MLLDWYTFTFLLLAVFMNGTWFTALMVPYATNRHGVIAVYYILLYGCGSISGAYFLSIYLGLVGSAVALFIAESIMAILVIKVALKMTQLRGKVWFGHILRRPLDLFFYGFSFFYRLANRHIYASQTINKTSVN